jgi:hypothetical protein
MAMAAQTGRKSMALYGDEYHFVLGKDGMALDPKKHPKEVEPEPVEVAATATKSAPVEGSGAEALPWPHKPAATPRPFTVMITTSFLAKMEWRWTPRSTRKKWSLSLWMQSLSQHPLLRSLLSL